MRVFWLFSHVVGVLGISRVSRWWMWGIYVSTFAEPGPLTPKVRFYVCF